MPSTENLVCPVCLEAFMWGVNNSAPPLCPYCGETEPVRLVAMETRTPIAGVKGGFAIGGFDNT